MGFSLITIKQSEITETFKDMPAEIPCWIFASKNITSDNAVSMLHTKLTQFSDEWSHHGNSIELGVTAIDKQVFVLYTHQAIGGCSRDSLLNHIQSLQGEINVEWVESGTFGLKINDKLTWAKVPEIKSLNTQGVINPETEVCQLHLHQVGQIQDGMLFTPASLSQLKRTIK